MNSKINHNKKNNNRLLRLEKSIYILEVYYILNI